MLESVSRADAGMKRLVSLLVILAKKLLHDSVGIAIGGFVLWVVGFPQDTSFLLHLFAGFLFFDLISWGLAKLSQYWDYQHSKSTISALTPIISIMAFWAVFCRCPLDVIFSEGHWQALVILLLYPTYKALHGFWGIFNSTESKTV